MTRQDIVKTVVEIILRHAKPLRIYLYGSQVSGEATETSDIDIAYDAPDFYDHALIEDDIEKLKTLIKIDARNLSRAEERFRNRIVSTGRVLYSANKKLRAEDALHNFSHALERFSIAVGQKNELEQEGFADVYPDLVMQRFEFTYEMAWKAIKRYLSFVGIDCTNPRSCFKEAFAQGLIKDEDVWLDMIEKRNLSSHTYDENEIKAVLEKVGSYVDVFENLRSILHSYCGEGS